MHSNASENNNLLKSFVPDCRYIIFEQTIDVFIDTFTVKILGTASCKC